MSASLLQPQGTLSPAEALKVAQEAPTILRSNPKAISASPLQFLFSSPETAELWTIYENLLLSCLRTSNDEAAHQCLERLAMRFGDENPRIMAFKGLVKEAQATNNSDLENVLAEYDVILGEDGSNVPIAKRKAALLRSMGKHAESAAALTSLLDFSPTDSEAWAELSDLYLTQGMYPQSIYALEEALVLQPNAWNVHARLGEILLMSAKVNDDNSSTKHVAEAIKRFARSIELCDDYLRGYYGLKIATDRALSGESQKSKKQGSDGFSLPDTATLEKLNETATKKLGEIVRRHSANEPYWQGYASDEVAAARALLDESASDVVR